MDIPSFIFTYGGPSGFLGIIVFLFVLDRRHHGERREELRKDLERVNGTVKWLWELVADLRASRSSLQEKWESEHRKRLEAEEELRRCRNTVYDFEEAGS